MCFPMKYAKFIRKPVLKNICERLLLDPFDFVWNTSYQIFKSNFAGCKLAVDTSHIILEFLCNILIDMINMMKRFLHKFPHRNVKNSLLSYNVSLKGTKMKI